MQLLLPIFVPVKLVAHSLAVVDAAGVGGVLRVVVEVRKAKKVPTVLSTVRDQTNNQLLFQLLESWPPTNQLTAAGADLTLRN